METENIVEPIATKQCRLIGWSVPEKGWIKVNSDGAMKQDSGLAATGE